MKRTKKVQGDQLLIDELMLEADAIALKPPKKALKKEPLYRSKKP